ncbi:MAG: response regulator [Balneolaceae bacterium]
MNKTIFLIDDDSILRLIVEMTMKKVDDTLSFIQCENGKIGLEKLNEHFQGESSNFIVLLDLNMPVLDGWGFLDTIQADHSNTYKNMSLYILSSSTDRVDIEKSKQYSFVKNFYHKPLSIVEINEILNS